MICEKCRHLDDCFEQRGRCKSFETEKQYRKRIKNDIEMLNKKQSAAISGRSDEGGVPKAGDGRGEIHSCDPISLRSEARANSEPQASSEAKSGKAVEGQTQAGS